MQLELTLAKTIRAVLPLLAIVSGAASAQSKLPQTFEAGYSLYSRGAKIAEMRRILRPLNNGLYQYRSETRTTGLIALFRNDHIVEESTWLLHGESLRPLRYLYEHSRGKKDRNVAVDFDWASRRITNTINGDSWLMPAEPDVLDKLLYQFAIMYDLSSGRIPRYYTIADGGKIKSYEFESLGEETVKTPLGNFQTLKFSRHREDSDRKTTFWCAPDLDFLPVKVEHVEKDGARTVVVIDSVMGLRSCSAPEPSAQADGSAMSCQR